MQLISLSSGCVFCTVRAVLFVVVVVVAWFYCWMRAVGSFVLYCGCWWLAPLTLLSFAVICLSLNHSYFLSITHSSRSIILFFSLSLAFSPSSTLCPLISIISLPSLPYISLCPIKSAESVDNSSFGVAYPCNQVGFFFSFATVLIRKTDYISALICVCNATIFFFVLGSLVCSLGHSNAKVSGLARSHGTIMVS